jgi:hypothetical protein
MSFAKVLGNLEILGTIRIPKSRASQDKYTKGRAQK